MTDELKPCPFCGVTFEIWCDKYRTWAIAKHKPWCFFPNMHNHEIPEQDFDAWNTRAERTCRNLDKHYDIMFKCSECGHWESQDFDGEKMLPQTWNYCPNCGAKVVD